jgi:hypothetical protein
MAFTYTNDISFLILSKIKLTGNDMKRKTAADTN